jgi:4-hydroxy-tetrahydrodipicolinate synthase
VAAVSQHFVSVATATDLPLCIYNNPNATHFAFSNELIARLSAVPRVVAVKNPAPPPSDAAAKVDALRRKLPADFAVGYSVDWHAAAAVLAGGAAWYSVVGGLLPSPSLALLRAAQAKDADEYAGSTRRSNHFGTCLGNSAAYAWCTRRLICWA